MSYRFEVLLLGTNSALPSKHRFPSAQLLYFKNHQFLIDCGEGTQLRIAQSPTKRNKINHIFISHLHGDHVYGLPGLLGSYNHYHRSSPLTVYGPPGIKEFLSTCFRVSQAHFSYPLSIIEITPDQFPILYIDDEVKVTFFSLKHRVPTLGFRFDYVPISRNIKPEKIEEYQLTIPQIKQIVSGDNLTLSTGEIITNEELTYQKHPPKSYAYCSDTIYDESIIDHIEYVDMLYHETTYLDGMETEAKNYMHSTIGQAIQIAEKAKVTKLLTGHYSSRYDNLSAFAEAGKTTPIDVYIGRDLESYQF